MNDPILYLSMILGLAGIYTLITSFSDDDDNDNDDGDGTILGSNFEYIKI